jgi:hypothetical protein
LFKRRHENPASLWRDISIGEQGAKPRDFRVLVGDFRVFLGQRRVACVTAGASDALYGN